LAIEGQPDVSIRATVTHVLFSAQARAPACQQAAAVENDETQARHSARRSPRHPPPHFHARYSGEEAVIAIATGEVIAGSLPGRALRLVREWTSMHREAERQLGSGARARALADIEPLP
jgi:hypothetical protein